MSPIFNYIFVALGLASGFIDVSRGHALVPRPNCDLKKCPGPLYYYEEIGCTPIYEDETSCCPVRYNCDRWNNYSEGDDCLVNGHVYKFREPIKKGDVQSLCNICECGAGCHPVAHCGFTPSVDDSGCRRIEHPLGCCTALQVCDNNPFKCTVDGKTYKIGEKFTPQAEPEKTCYCLEGYNGVNNEDYCRWEKPSWCHNVIGGIYSITGKCAPVYEQNIAQQMACNNFTLCQDSETPVVIKTVGPSVNDPNLQCQFGNLTMGIRDTLVTQVADYNRRKVNCVCEVPPVPTCRYYYDE